MSMSLKPRYFDDHYPWQRLAVAVLVRAVKDARVVEKRIPKRAQRSAREFLADEGVRDTFLMLDVPADVWAMCDPEPGRMAEKQG